MAKRVPIMEKTGLTTLVYSSGAENQATHFYTHPESDVWLWQGC